VTDVEGVARGTPFDEGLLDVILQSVKVGEEIRTLSNQRANRIEAIDADGISVTTGRSTRMGTGPQKVPAWMITRAWNHICKHGYLTQQGLLHDLDVKRSAFVCALLAKFPGVEVETVRPTLLRLAARHLRPS